ncbi:MAG: GLPGLI family protein [Bernardetiaceae bacterium]
MKKYSLFASVLFFFFDFAAIAQITEGYITYEHTLRKKTEEERKIQEDKVRKQVSNPMLQEEVIRSLRKSSEEAPTFAHKLVFTAKHSLYALRETSLPIGKKDGSLTYYDLEEKRFTFQKYIFEKAFLIEEVQEPIAWELIDSTRTLIPFRVKMAKTTVDSVEVIAWYTPEILVSSGPDIFHGLPGMILEIYQSDGVSIVFKGYSANFDKALLQKPTKGEKLASRAVFDQKRQAAADRLNERVRNGEKITIGSLGEN